MKNEIKHTQGPWKVYGYQVQFNLDKTPLYGVGADKGENPGLPLAGPLRNMADAHLIAAAPELLAWMKAVVRQLDYEVSAGLANGGSGSGGMREQLNKIIAKAEGEGL